MVKKHKKCHLGGFQGRQMSQNPYVLALGLGFVKAKNCQKSLRIAIWVVSKAAKLAKIPMFWP